MVKQFPREFDINFTSEMETELDKVEDGKKEWRTVLKQFWTPFAKSVASVLTNVGPAPGKPPGPANGTV